MHITVYGFTVGDFNEDPVPDIAAVRSEGTGYFISRQHQIKNRNDAIKFQRLSLQKFVVTANLSSNFLIDDLPILMGYFLLFKIKTIKNR